MDYKVTVGIPVYNVEKYIEACVLSVLNQTMDGIELIIVDDRGTDKSMSIIRQLSQKHPKGNTIRIIEHELNRGVAHGRNTIIDNARGKYLYLIDSDDFISPDAIETLYKKAEDTQSETVWGSMQECYEETGKKGVYRQYPDIELFGGGELIKFECASLNDTLQHSVCNILYLMDFIITNKLRFKEYGGYDDTLFHAEMQPLVKRAVLMSKFTYTYYKHSNSISQFNYRKEFKIKEAYDAIGASESIISHCKTLNGKPYFDVKCAKVMKQATFMLCGVLRHRNKMTDGEVTNKRLKQWFQNPATFVQIMSFKRYKMSNLIFWTLGKLPTSLFITAMKIIGKLKGYL